MPADAHGTFDPLAVVRVLAEHGVAYILCGGVAARLHGSDLLTEDLDLAPAQDAANLGRLARALEEMGARLAVPDPPEGLRIPLDERTFSSPVMTFRTQFGDVDVLRHTLSRGGYAELRDRAVAFDVLGLDVRAIALEDLIADKEASGRPKDRGKLPSLHALRDELRRREGRR